MKKYVVGLYDNFNVELTLSIIPATTELIAVEIAFDMHDIEFPHFKTLDEALDFAVNCELVVSVLEINADMA